MIDLEQVKKRVEKILAQYEEAKKLAYATGTLPAVIDPTKEWLLFLTRDLVAEVERLQTQVRDDTININGYVEQGGILQREKAELESKVCGMKEILEKFAFQIIRSQEAGDSPITDHACAQCVPNGEIVRAGFICIYHTAKALSSTPECGHKKEVESLQAKLTEAKKWCFDDTVVTQLREELKVFKAENDRLRDALNEERGKMMEAEFRATHYILGRECYCLDTRHFWAREQWTAEGRKQRK